ncbi:hypothetical protein WH221_21810 [Chryseobacterium culicis]|uniref:Uncharacterized protein n=1 Tax=Chryseobacterium culicis TaxID=680127 RepID=A0A2S9CIM6_CHRCI|nr:hypothetical protein [Chryseobacterium culicis]PRB80319.1 hypothetical protein CQ022_21740 [Chryseobacterium culicis]PRB87392.1 hypothetical protein CQ033_21745 [Chryseobacterium culicis]
MKKILLFLFLGAVGFTAYSCDNSDDVVVAKDYDTINQSFDISPTFTRVSDNLYRWSDDFNSPLVQSDMVLIYMQNGTDGDSPVWKLLPYTSYVGNANNDAVDYIFDFSKYAATININSTNTFSLTANPTYYQNKKFRVLILPANGTGTGGAKAAKGSAVDYNDYKSVIKYYNIDESKIKTK